jgi:hypothetical protein
MRVATLALLTAVALCLATATPANAQSVTVNPEAGDQAVEFLFRGSGFTPGERIGMRFTSPAGVPYILLNGEGREMFLTVAGDGTFSLIIVPVDLFVGAPAGLWRAEFCPSAGEFCQAGTFTIRVE